MQLGGRDGSWTQRTGFLLHIWTMRVGNIHLNLGMEGGLYLRWHRALYMSIRSGFMERENVNLGTCLMHTPWNDTQNHVW